MKRLGWLGVVLVGLGCGDTRDLQEPVGGTGGAVSDTGASDGGDASDMPDDLLDVGGGNGHGDDGGGEMGCRGIDFLFVVDNSGSMKDEQESLIASFPGFVSAIETKVAELEADDFRILVTNTEEVEIQQPHAYCSFECPTTDGFCSIDDTPCEFKHDATCMQTCVEDLDNQCASGRTCREILDCDACGCELGAAVTTDMTGAACPIAGDKPYMQHGQPDLAATFSCLAEVGTDGDGNEKAAGAAVGALSDPMNAADGCNAGFVRNDTILVVTIITDEEDGGPDAYGGSQGDPPQWKDAIVAAKNGDPDAIVMLGLIGDGDMPGGICVDDPEQDGAEPSPRLRELVTSFPRHVVGSVCADDYAPFFEDAVDLIKETCEVYVPPQG